MNKKSFLFFFLFLFPFLTFAQSGYLVGTSRVSTEPDSTLFSVALSGYGYPPEGRFSIDWIPQGNTPGKISAITGLDGKFYVADSNSVFWMGTPSGKTIEWKKIGTADDILALTGIGEKLFAVNRKEELLTGKITHQNIKWKRIGDASSAKTLAVLNKKLYATTDQNELMSTDPSKPVIKWTNIGHADNVRSMTNHGKRLFAVNYGDTLWNIMLLKQNVPWMEIGRFNGITFDIHIKQIAVLNNRLYAVSKDNKLYISRHTTDGNLSATAMAIKNKGKTVVMVGVDLTGFDYSLTDEVKDIVSKERHIPKSAILINASHTHFPPTAQAYPTWAPFLHHPDTLYLNILRKGMVKAIENALDNMSPANLYFGRGETNIGLNRSSSNPEEPHDKTLDVLEARALNGKVKAVLFLTGCHAVFNNDGREGYTLSANFPGVTRKLIRDKTGANAIFIQGCAGDINPRSTDHIQTGTELADDIFKIMNESMTKINDDISFAFNTFNIPVKPWSIEKIKQFKVENSKNPEDVDAQKNVRWADLMFEKYKEGTVLSYLPEYIQFINIGNWKLVGLSREAVNEYGPAIRKIWPDKEVSVAGYCNDVSSYLPKEWHINNQTYEGYDSFFWYGQPGLPPINIFDIVINGIKSFKK